jgi:hypothetical protein
VRFKSKRSPEGSSGGSRLRFAILAATVAAFLLVPVAQAAAAETVKVNLTGTGKGKVNGSLVSYGGSPHLECSNIPGEEKSVCKVEMVDEGDGYEAVLAQATAAAGSKFVKWTIQEGFTEGCGTFNACFPYSEPGEEGPAEITAEFAEVPGFFLTIAKTGEGTINSSPAGIVCTGAKTGPSKYAGECQEKFEGTVTLTASPASGYAFSAWAGCTEHVGLTCKVTMAKATTVKATFVATPSLAIEKAGSGQGKVTATGISCDENCPKASSAVKTGTAVTVKATPAKGSEVAIFESGTGNASACSSSCEFTISENSSVKVKFNPIPTSKLTVNLTGPGAYKGKVTGKGTVKGLTGSAINCGSGCTTQTESFFSTDSVTLTAAPSTGYTFAGWSLPAGSNAGTCTGTTSPCIVPTSSAKTLAAEFK